MKRKSHENAYSNLSGVNTKKSDYVTDQTECLNLVNLDGHEPFSWTKRPGSTSIATGSTGAVRSVHEFSRLNGFSQIVAGDAQGLHYLAAGGFTSILSGASPDQPFDCLNFVNWMWAANGSTFIKWDGSNAYAFGLPKHPEFVPYGDGNDSAATLNGMTNPYTFYALSYVGPRGDIGPAKIVLATESLGGVYAPYRFTTVTINNITAPTGYGITAIAIFKGTREYEAGFFDVNTAGFFDEEFQFGNVDFGFVAYVSTGLTTYSDLSGSTTVTGIEPLPESIYQFTLAPSFIEIHKNSLFMSGFSSALSDIRWSEIGEPETIQPEYQAEVRTNDGDYIRGKKSFGNQLLIFKEKSFHKLIGDNVNNYELDEISSEYGLLSNKAVVVFNDICAFLDPKGIVFYDGASWTVATEPIQPFLRRMNISAARQKACAVHYPFRTQIWFGIPIDGSSVNNFTIVYNYSTKMWSFHEGYNAAGMTEAYGSESNPTVHMGDYSGKVHVFSPSLYSDNGTGFTCLALTRFHAPDGRNVENIFRRLFLDMEPVTGVTGAVTVEFFKNNDETTSITSRTFYQDVFQGRKEIGIPARSLAMQITQNNVSLPLTIKGYVLARRFLRTV